MFIYFDILLFLILSLFIPQKVSFSIKVIIFILFSLYIGLRENIGSDWYQYLDHYNIISTSYLKDVLFRLDPGYVLLNSFSSMIGGGIYLVNFISAIIFLYGLFVFIKKFNLKLSLSLLIAYPYLITVIAMGYTRQSIAIGFLMLVFTELKDKNKHKAIIFLILGILFHKTAVFGLIFFIDTFSAIWILISLIFILGLILVFYNTIYFMYEIYILHSMQSSGGMIRVLILVIMAIVFFYYRKKWKYYYIDEYFLVRKMSILSILFFIAIIMTHATTLFDRLSLYLYPLQIIMLNRIFNLEKDKYLKMLFFVGIIVLYSLLLLIWLIYGTHTYAWIPYDNILLRIFQ